MPLSPGKPFELKAAVDCLGGCQLLQLGIGREALDQAGVEGDVVISKIASADRPDIPLGAPTDWNPVRQTGSDQGSITAEAGGVLTIAVRSLGNDQLLQYATVPAVVPALITPEYPYNDSATTSPAIDGSPMDADQARPAARSGEPLPGSRCSGRSRDGTTLGRHRRRIGDRLRGLVER